MALRPTDYDSGSSRASDEGRDLFGEIDLIELLYRFAEKAWLILLIGLLGAVLFGLYTSEFVTPMYSATAKLYLINSSDSAINLSDLSLASNLTADYTEVFKNWHVHERVVETLGLQTSYRSVAGMISVTNPRDTRILYITARGSDPVLVRDVANAYAEVGREFIAVTMEMHQPSIFEEARVPSAPYSPNLSKAVTKGFVLGAAAVMAVLTILFLMDDRIRTADDIEKICGLPTLGSMPKHERGAKARKKREARRKQRASAGGKGAGA